MLQIDKTRESNTQLHSKIKIFPISEIFDIEDIDEIDQEKRSFF